MQSTYLARRGFIKAAATIAAAGVLPARAGAQTIGRRIEWNEFRNSSAFPGYLKAIRAMRANTDSGDRRSWAYWTGIHVNACPHGVPYFLAWHRGFLHYFQHVVRELSGNSTLMLPYWDYYSNPVLPAEFTDPAPDNPLYVEGRKNTNVLPSLTLSPFLSRYRNFQRGVADAFEPVIEVGPHGTFHNIVGGAMAGMSSPMDPIFWLHHAQIDRLWSAWASAGGGRQMPSLTDSYWSGYHVYTKVIKIARKMTYDTTSRLYYDYANTALPTSLPSAIQAAGGRAVAYPSEAGTQRLRRPPSGNFAEAAPRETLQRRSFVGVRSIALDEHPVTAQFMLSARDGEALRATADPQGTGQRNDGRRFRYANLVLDVVATTALGGAGGYFYDIYLNLPEEDEVEAEHLLVGQFGPFEIDARRHHGGPVRLSFALRPVLQRAETADTRDLAVSFIRRRGRDLPAGTTITIGELRIELSNEPAS